MQRPINLLMFFPEAIILYRPLNKFMSFKLFWKIYHERIKIEIFDIHTIFLMKKIDMRL